MVFSRFESFSIRPPTPPKDAKDIDSEVSDALQFLDDPFGTKQLLSAVPDTKSLLNTPEQSPSSETGTSSSSSRKKRVNFEPQICTIPDSQTVPHPWTPRHSSPLRPLPQTRVSKPLKSILKASDTAPTSSPTEGTAAHKFQSFADMLESVVKMLAQGARPSKLDAYISLQRTMQAYDKIPDTQALITKMGLFSQFIRRDMQAVGISGSGPDSPLITQALKFLMVLVRIPELKAAMDDDFCSFTIDRIIAVTSDVTMPKAIINTHLALLMQQNFRPRIMTVARAEKILEVLETVTDHVTGYSVHAYRIRVYRKLIQQRPDTMIKHTERWFKHILNAMLASQKDIHHSALDTAICAAKTIGSDRHVTKSILAILNRVKSDGNSFGKHFAQALEKTLSSDSAPLVPQVWAAVTAFLQDSLQESTFSATRDWLMVLEKFFSSESEAVRIHANVAFNFLIYAVNITQLTPINWSKMFVNISQHQLGQRSQARKSEIDTATSAYFTLLYYALRPTASHAQLDRYWNEFVADFWTPLVHSSSSKLAIAACRVASALFNGSRKPWNEQRALELKPHLMTQRGELPLLDPKWVRKALVTILKFVETLLDAAPWNSEAVDDEPVKTMWMALLDSLMEASSKEVMASSETKDAIAHIVNMLRRMWDRHTSQLALPQHKEDSWADKFCFLVETVIQKLGAMQFADKCLTRNGHDEFEVAPTPSNRSRQHGPRISPLLYFVDLLVSRSEGKLSDLVRLRVLQLILDPCLNAQNTRLAKLELIRDCSAAAHPISRNTVASNFWNRIAISTKSCIQEQPSDSNERISRQLGKEYEVVVEILALGSPYLLHTPRGQEVLITFVETVRREAGEGAVVLAVIERVSDNVLTKVNQEDYTSCLPYASILLKSLPKTIIRRTIEQGRQNLYPSSPPPARNPEFDPYNHFYSAIVAIGAEAYHKLEVDEAESTREFLAALGSSIQQTPISLLAVYLRKVQQSIKIWIEDSDKKLQDEVFKQLHSEVIKLWQAVSAAIEKLPRKDSSILVTLEPLINSGFVSRRRRIVNISIKTWNDTFGKEESLRYPARLEKSLRRLHNVVDLSVPGLESREDDPDDQLSLYDSNSSTVGSPREAPTSRVKESPFRVRKSVQKARSPAISSAISRKQPSRRTPKIRLRHENSQIQFEPIVSSPTNPLEQESQILTERQKEMIERQRIASKIFANMGSNHDSQSNEELRQQLPQELLSDALNSDDLPNDGSRTPLKALAAMGPMDVYLGSSPTPSAKNRSELVLSDDTNVATPEAVRTVQLADGLEELNSSPPRFERETVPAPVDSMGHGVSGDTVSDSFGYGQSEDPYSQSFDDGTTIDEEVLLDVEDDLPTELDGSDMPSSTVELQLNAQLNAEFQARGGSSPLREATSQVDVQKESNNVFVDTHSHHILSMPTQESLSFEAHVEETQLSQADSSAIERSEVESGESSRVGDSFSDPVAGKEALIEPDPSPRKPRRSSRHSISSQVNSSRAKKRKESPISLPRKAKKNKQETVQAEAETEDDDILDCIVVASSPVKSPSKRKSRSKSRTPTESQSIVPETTRKRAIRRSTSSNKAKSQIEDVVEDTPAPKRPRKSASQDVSEAKVTPPKSCHTSQAKRLSHVQIASRHPLSRSTSVGTEENTTIVEEAPASATQVGSTTGEQLTNMLAPQSRHSTPAPADAQQASAALATPSRSFAERVILTPKSILAQIKKLASDCKQLVLGREEEVELDSAAHALMRAVWEAGRREGETRQ